MNKDFAIRLESVHAIFNSKDTALYERATEELRKLVKEAYEGNKCAQICDNGNWMFMEELPIFEEDNTELEQ